MAITRDSFKFRYKETINGQVQPWTDWLPFTESNSTIVGYNVSLQVGDINIGIGLLEIQTPNEWPYYGEIIKNNEPYTSTIPDVPEEPEPVGFPYTFDYNLS